MSLEARSSARKLYPALDTAEVSSDTGDAPCCVLDMIVSLRRIRPPASYDSTCLESWTDAVHQGTWRSVLQAACRLLSLEKCSASAESAGVMLQCLYSRHFRGGAPFTSIFILQHTPPASGAVASPATAYHMAAISIV